MEADIQKAIDAGKISPKAGATLSSLQPGTYCFHKSWGFGQIENLNFLVNQITINFQSKKGHTMQLDYAAESLQPLADDHILAQKAKNLEGVRTQAKEDPVGLVRQVLKSYNKKATQEQIARALVGDVFNETEFKRWWDNAKKLLKKDGHFGLPAKKTDPIELRDAAVSRGDELLAAFTSSRQLKDQLLALDQILKNLDAFSDVNGQLQPVILAIEESTVKNQKLNTIQAFELLLSREEFREKSKGLQASSNVTLSKLIQEEERRLSDIIELLPAAKLKRLISALPEAFGENWAAKVIMLLLRANARAVAEISRLLQEKGKEGELHKELDRWIRDHSATPDILYWLCKERKGAAKNLLHPGVLSTILTALERDEFGEIKRGTKLHDLLLSDRELIADLLDEAEPGIVRDSMRRLMLTPAFEELDKRSLLARVIRIHPEVQSMLANEESQRREALVVSWESLEKRKLEYEDLISKKIPENTKEISVARSYGDLRENFEFKAAKEMQAVLMRRKAELEIALANARGTDFKNPDTTQVSIGTIVKLKDTDDGKVEIYTILGAWDSEPEKGIISYPAAIAQALLGRKVGDVLEVPMEFGTKSVEILEITPYNP